MQWDSFDGSSAYQESLAHWRLLNSATLEPILGIKLKNEQMIAFAQGRNAHQTVKFIRLLRTALHNYERGKRGTEVSRLAGETPGGQSSSSEVRSLSGTSKTKVYLSR